MRIFKTDPESFVGKLLLLVVDKLIIGALIAVVLLVFDRWRTVEQRHYNEAQEETQLAFKRAEYVKQLVPVVLDEKADIVVRAQNLVALIRTNSVDDKTAFVMARRLLNAGVVYADQPYATLKDDDSEEEERVSFRWSGEHFLIDALATRLPQATPVLLETFLLQRAEAIDDSSSDEDETVESRHQAEGIEFLERLFKRSIKASTDNDLAVWYGDKSFMTRNWHVLSQWLTPTEDEARQWFGRDVMGLRLLAATEMLSYEWGDHPRRGEALQYAATYAFPEHLTSENMGLAAVVLEDLQKNRVYEPQIVGRATKALAALVGRNFETYLVRSKWLIEHGDQDRFTSALGEYLRSALKDARRKTENLAIVVRTALPLIRTFEISDFANSKARTYNTPQWFLVAALAEAPGMLGPAPVLPELGKELDRLVGAPVETLKATSLAKVAEYRNNMGGLAYIEFSQDFKSVVVRNPRGSPVADLSVRVAMLGPSPNFGSTAREHSFGIDSIDPRGEASVRVENFAHPDPALRAWNVFFHSPELGHWSQQLRAFRVVKPDGGEEWRFGTRLEMVGAPGIVFEKLPNDFPAVDWWH